MRMDLVRTLPALALALTVGACAGGEAEDTGPTSGLDSPDRTLALTPEPVYAVGGLDAPDWAAFSRISSVGFDDAGNLYILDTRDQIVTVVAPDGTFLRTVGRPGEGPGELGSPMAMVVRPDGGLAVFDFGHRGWVEYDATGEFVRNTTVDVAEVGIPTSDPVMHPDGFVVAGVGIRLRSGPSAGGDTVPPGRPVVRYPLGAEAGEAGVLYRAWNMPEPEETQSRSLGSSGGTIELRASQERAFEPELHLAVLPDGRIAVADSIGYRVKLVSASGTLTGTLERPVPPTPVDEAIQEAERQRRLDRIAGQGGGNFVSVGGGGRVTIDQDAVRRMLEDRVAGMIFAPEIPVIEALAADPQGRIWVQRSSGEPGVDGPTDLITADGRYLGTLAADGLRIPDAFGPGGLVARIETDEFDVPTVVVEHLPDMGG